MSITKKHFGTTENGIPIEIYELTNSKGMEAHITNFGGIIVSLIVPDTKGNYEDIVLGFDNLKSYERKGPYFGAIIGRHANRIKNASFEIDGIQHLLYKNDGENHLHGGKRGFDKAVWKSHIIEGEHESLQLTYISKDGEEGYPGNLKVKVIYSITEDNELKIEYYAVSDKDTVVNLTNHSYFNLSGHSSGNILEHKLMLNADEFTVNDGVSIPTGEILRVEGTPMDFRSLTEVGKGIDSSYSQTAFAKGYDHNWILNTNGNLSVKAAEVVDENSGRVMEVFTTKPGIQFYTGNFLDSTDIGKDCIAYPKRSGLCLETQYFPNSLEYKHFPTPILKKGEEYNHTTIYKFRTIP